MKLQSIKPAGRGFAPCCNLLKGFMVVDTVIITYFHLCGVYIISTCLLAQPPILGKEKQGQVYFLFKLNETGIGNRLRKIAFPCSQNSLLVVIFKTLKSCDMVKNN